MRLSDTLTKTKVRASAAARGRSACTSAGRPSTSARTSATRGRSSSACGCAAGCAHRGYDVTLVHNITDINDRIYEAAPGASAELAARATEWYLEDTDAARVSAAPTRCRRRAKSSPQIIRFISELIEVATRTRSEGDVYFRVARVPGLRTPVGPAARPGRGAGAEPAQGGPARLRALEGEQAGRGHVVGLALGTWPSRLAHRVLRDGRGAARAGVRDPRRRARPRLPASRERAARSRARSATTSRRSGRTTACSASPARRCRSRRATSSRSATRSSAGDARRSSSTS